MIRYIVYLLLLKAMTTISFLEDTFKLYAGIKITEHSNMIYKKGVSNLQCAYSCYAGGRCCALSYNHLLKACTIEMSENCYPSNQKDASWDMFVRKKLDKPRDCRSFDGGSGVYAIYHEGEGRGLEVFCDMETDGGGWMLFQRRIDGEVDFNVGWSHYEIGFGDIRKGFWMGKDLVISRISKSMTLGNY